MNKYLLLLLLFAFSLLISCKDQRYKNDFLAIKNMGDSDPIHSLYTLDSLYEKISAPSTNITIQYKLIKTRLKDKAYINATSDNEICQVVDYYKSHGTNTERQEALYYAGSVYRDLNDIPRSLEYFLNSVKAGETNNNCDSIILRNSYSNISYLFNLVQDYPHALEYAQKEKNLTIELGEPIKDAELRLGYAYAYCDSADLAIASFDTAMVLFSNEMEQQNLEALCSILYYYSFYKQKDKAYNCYCLIKDLEIQTCKNGLLALSEFYSLMEDDDASIASLKEILRDSDVLMHQYDAAKNLFLNYYSKNDWKEASEFANLYILLSDSLDLGGRQELAATVNNQYQYYRNKEKENKIIEEKETYFRWLLSIATISLVVLLLGFYLFEKYKNKQLRTILSVSDELKVIKNERNSLSNEIFIQHKELNIAKESLRLSIKELVETQEKLVNTNSQLRICKEELKQKEELIDDKTNQNIALIRLLHQANMNEQCEDIIQKLDRCSRGLDHLSTDDWDNLYIAVDKQFPTFKDQIINELGDITNEKIQFCYLLRIGLSKTQIQNIMSVSRATIWRWEKKYSWISFPERNSSDSDNP